MTQYRIYTLSIKIEDSTTFCLIALETFKQFQISPRLHHSFHSDQNPAECCAVQDALLCSFYRLTATLLYTSGGQVELAPHLKKQL